MRAFAIVLLALLLVPFVCFAAAAHSKAAPAAAAEHPAGSAAARQPVVFATFAESEADLKGALVLTESIRAFGGEMKDASIWVFVPVCFLDTQKETLKKFAVFKADIKTSNAPDESLGFASARRVFAAAKAEIEANGAASVLVWMDEDAVLLGDPKEFKLAKGVSFGYRPVAKQGIGTLYGETPNAFWSRLYEKLSVPKAAIFPMKTAADGKTLRPYFSAGLLVVRPERGILVKWSKSFSLLYKDRVVAEMCRKGADERAFLHQAALTGAVLALLKKDEMVELSDGYNYPLFFKEMYGGTEEFNDVSRVVTLKYGTYFQNPAPNWGEKLRGPAETISWLKERLGQGGGKKPEANTKMRQHFEEGKGSE